MRAPTAETILIEKLSLVVVVVESVVVSKQIKSSVYHQSASVCTEYFLEERILIKSERCDS